MDFTRSEAELEVCRLAGQVLGGRGTQATATDASQGTDHDVTAWKELAQAGLLSLGVPAELGGDGLGALATACLLTEVGRHAVRLPALATLALGVLPVARSADADHRRTLLTGVASGDTILTAAIREPSDPMPSSPATTALFTGESGTVSGVKVGVPYAGSARWMLVPAA
jgi:alkylation response protein AidB-like acyl-CoA dehydrogenase